MSRLQFDIKYRPQIESGEYKVETRDGRPARIICWDIEYYYPQYKIGALIKNDGGEDFFFLTEKGYFCIKESGECDSNNDLFIVTPKEELTDFEQEVSDIVEYCKRNGENVADGYAKRHAKSLLSLAREQFIKDGYIIEKKAFHDAVENISDKHRAEMSVQYAIHCKIENGTRHAIMNWDTFQKVAQKFIDIGKADALKDIPRWKRFAPNINDTLSEQRICNELENIVLRVDVGGYCWIISREELNRLPKEDEK